MNTQITRRAGLSASRFAKRAMYAVSLTALTLPAAFAQSVSPGDKPAVPAAELLRIQEQRSLLPAARLGSKTRSGTATAKASGSAVPLRVDLGNVSNTTWESIGPFGSRVVSGSQGALGVLGSYVAGRVNGVAYDPKNANIIYAATAGGGLWRYNAASTLSAAPTYPWRPLGDKFPSLACNCVTVSPFNSNVVFAGTTAGIQRSINGGNSFVTIGTQLGSVTKIIVDPDRSNTLFATSTGGGISVSTDLGNSWSNVAPGTRLDDGVGAPNSKPQPIGEEWNGVAISAADPADKNAVKARSLYATSRRGGLYQSLDRGATWNLVNAPLRYNPIYDPNTGTTPHFDPYRGGYGIKVATSLTDPKTVYVMDSNELFNDGKIFVSRDAGATWTEISGSYPVNEGPSNNWSISSRNLAMIAIPQSVLNEFGMFDSVDAVLGSVRTTYSTLFSGDSVLNAIYPGRDWTFAGQTHVDQKDFSYTPTNPLGVIAANEGGIYGMVFDPNSGTWAYSPTPYNAFLAATEFYATAFHPFRELTALGGTINNGVTRTQGSKTGWSQIPTVPGPFGPLRPRSVLVDELPTGAGNPDGFFGGPPDESVNAGLYVGSVAYDSGSPNIQYIYGRLRSGSGSDRGTILVTTDNWQHGFDITPSRTIHNAQGTSFVLADGVTKIYAFNQVNAQDSSTPTNWAGETKRYQGILAVDPSESDLGSSLLYSGGYFLWRYDLRPGIAPIVNKLNVDRGIWRRVGTTQLATPETVNGTMSEDYITAIAVTSDGGRVYVGTHLGRLWMTRFPRNADSTVPIPLLTAPWLKMDNSTLPSRFDPPTPGGQIRREITTISVNENTSLSDIVVGVAGAGVFRCANTLSQNFLFTTQNGTGIGTNLPDLNVTTIARDTISGDPDNSWLVGTSSGVYSTINQGSSWADATVPLGLPQVPIVSLDINPFTGFASVGTAGRGAWRFDLEGSIENTAAPNLGINYALSRNAGVIYGTITVNNLPSVANPNPGQAQNVQITSAKLNTRSGGITEAVSTPVKLGTIGVGANSSRTTTVTWPNGAGKPGEVVILTVTVTYNSASGKPVTLTSRTRLP